MISTRRLLLPERPESDTVYAVIDTNVIVSAMIAHDDSSPTVRVLEEALGGQIVPLFSQYLVDEYKTVLSRERFSIPKGLMSNVVAAIVSRGLRVEPDHIGTCFEDPKDAPIFAIATETRNIGSYLITGNIKHYPPVDYVITPRMASELLDSENKPDGL
jgi:putative PIN family toxin of toxin-antitoxin system